MWILHPGDCHELVYVLLFAVAFLSLLLYRFIHWRTIQSAEISWKTPRVQDVIQIKSVSTGEIQHNGGGIKWDTLVVSLVLRHVLTRPCSAKTTHVTLTCGNFQCALDHGLAPASFVVSLFSSSTSLSFVTRDEVKECFRFFHLVGFHSVVFVWFICCSTYGGQSVKTSPRWWTADVRTRACLCRSWLEFLNVFHLNFRKRASTKHHVLCKRNATVLCAL